MNEHVKGLIGILVSFIGGYGVGRLKIWVCDKRTAKKRTREGIDRGKKS